jgi:hypothetical protein
LTSNQLTRGCRLLQADKQPEESRGQGYVFKYAYFNTDSKCWFSANAFEMINQQSKGTEKG